MLQRIVSNLHTKKSLAAARVADRGLRATRVSDADRGAARILCRHVELPVYLTSI